MKRLFTGALAALFALAASAATLTPVQLLNPAGSTSGQAIVSTGASTAPAWSNVTASGLTPVAANTVIANATASSASPTAVSVPGCNGAAQALQWTNASGFGCNSNVATSGANTNITSLSSPALGSATANTAATNTNTTQVATTAFVESEFANPPSAGFGSTTARPVAATTLTSTTSGSTSSIAVTDTGANGSNIKMTGNGATTPSKTLRVVSGAFGIVNNAYNSQILTLSDAGNLSVTGSIAPSSTAGIVGTATNDNASAGSVGEYQTNSITGTSLTSGTNVNAISISLTAGDWDVQGVAVFNPQASTTVQYFSAGISTTSVTYGAIGSRALLQAAFATGGQGMMTTPTVRISLSTTTTVYLVASASFGVSTMTVDGFIRARRVR